MKYVSLIIGLFAFTVAKAETCQIAKEVYIKKNSQETLLKLVMPQQPNLEYNSEKSVNFNTITIKVTTAVSMHPAPPPALFSASVYAVIDSHHEDRKVVFVRDIDGSCADASMDAVGPFEVLSL